MRQRRGRRGGQLLGLDVAQVCGETDLVHGGTDSGGADVGLDGGGRMERVVVLVVAAGRGRRAPCAVFEVCGERDQEAAARVRTGLGLYGHVSGDEERSDEEDEVPGHVPGEEDGDPLKGIGVGAGLGSAAALRRDTLSH